MWPSALVSSLERWRVKVAISNGLLGELKQDPWLSLNTTPLLVSRSSGLPFLMWIYTGALSPTVKTWAQRGEGLRCVFSAPSCYSQKPETSAETTGRRKGGRENLVLLHGKPTDLAREPPNILLF